MCNLSVWYDADASAGDLADEGPHELIVEHLKVSTETHLRHTQLQTGANALDPRRQFGPIDATTAEQRVELSERPREEVIADERVIDHAIRVHCRLHVARLFSQLAE